MLQIRLKNNNGYLEWILLNGKKTLMSKVTGSSYTWFIEHYPDCETANKFFGLIYDDISQYKLSSGICLGLWYNGLLKLYKQTQVSSKINDLCVFQMSVEQLPNTQEDLPKLIEHMINDYASDWDDDKGENNSKETIEYEKQTIDKSDVLVLGRYSEVLFELQQYRSSTGYINASSKLQSLQTEYNNYEESLNIDELYYAEIDVIDGHRLPSYEMLLNIKAFQQEEVMNKFLDKVFDERFTKLVENKVLDYILTIPNNTSKKINFNEYATQYLIAHYPQYNTMILPYESISVNDFPSRKPQKTIRGIGERLENANKLFSCEQFNIPNKSRVLLIDDAFGSGATMNMVAKKIKEKYPDSTIIGFAFNGSMRKGFDVLSEV